MEPTRDHTGRLRTAGHADGPLQAMAAARPPHTPRIDGSGRTEHSRTRGSSLREGPQLVGYGRGNPSDALRHWLTALRAVFAAWIRLTCARQSGSTPRMRRWPGAVWSRPPCLTSASGILVGFTRRGGPEPIIAHGNLGQAGCLVEARPLAAGSVGGATEGERGYCIVSPVRISNSASSSNASITLTHAAHPTGSPRSSTARPAATCHALWGPWALNRSFAVRQISSLFIAGTCPFVVA